MNHKKQSNKDEFDMKRNLIVNYLPQTFTQDEVRQLFLKIGPVNNCKLIRNYTTGQSLGYAFIEYPTAELAESAITQLDGLSIQDKKLKVSYARPSSAEIQNSNVYVAGLPEWVTESELLNMFKRFGQIVTHKILIGPDNKSKGVGFVRFSLKSDAETAIESMCGTMLQDSTQPLTVKLAIPPASKQGTVLAQAASTTMTGNKMLHRYNPMAPSNPALAISNPSLAVMNSGYPQSHQYPMDNSYVAHRQNLSQQLSGTKEVHSIYVYGLQGHHTELTLYELFAPFGGILNVKLIRDSAKEGSPCKGYGFVNFRQQEDAGVAIGTMNQCPFEGKTLQVSFKQNSKPNSVGQSGLINVQMNPGVVNTPAPPFDYSAAMQHPSMYHHQ